MHVETIAVPGGRLPGEDTQPGKTERYIYLQTLEIKNREYTGEPNTTPKVRPMQDSHSCDKAGSAQACS